MTLGRPSQQHTRPSQTTSFATHLYRAHQQDPPPPTPPQPVTIIFRKNTPTRTIGEKHQGIIYFNTKKTNKQPTGRRPSRNRLYSTYNLARVIPPRGLSCVACLPQHTARKSRIPSAFHFSRDRRTLLSHPVATPLQGHQYPRRKKQNKKMAIGPFTPPQNNNTRNLRRGNNALALASPTAPSACDTRSCYAALASSKAHRGTAP